MGREEVRGGDSEGVKREKKTKEGEEVREFIVRKAKWAKENIFSRSEEDNIYRSYALCEREIVFQKKNLENNL